MVDRALEADEVGHRTRFVFDRDDADPIPEHLPVLAVVAQLDGHRPPGVDSPRISAAGSLALEKATVPPDDLLARLPG